MPNRQFRTAKSGKYVRTYVCTYIRNGGTHQISKQSPNDARRANFSTTRKFRRRENFRKKIWAAAIVFLQKSSKSELSSRFLSRSKFENFARHFLANSDKPPRIWANLIMIRPNLGTIGRIGQKVACAFFVIGTKEMSCSRNTRNVLLRTQGISSFEHKECPASNTRNVLL